jgi:hypothetical protein
MPTNLTRRVMYECEVLHMPAEKISLGEQRLSALRGVTKSANNAIVVAHGNFPPDPCRRRSFYSANSPIPGFGGIVSLFFAG